MAKSTKRNTSALQPSKVVSLNMKLEWTDRRKKTFRVYYDLYTLNGVPYVQLTSIFRATDTKGGGTNKIIYPGATAMRDMVDADYARSIFQLMINGKAKY
jgi:hypothetical protein